MRNTACHWKKVGRVGIKGSKLFPVLQVTGKKIKRGSPNTIVIKFRNKNIMVNGIEGFGKVKEYSNSVVVGCKSS